MSKCSDAPAAAAKPPPCPAAPAARLAAPRGGVVPRARGERFGEILRGASGGARPPGTSLRGVAPEPPPEPSARRAERAAEAGAGVARGAPATQDTPSREAAGSRAGLGGVEARAGRRDERRRDGEREDPSELAPFRMSPVLVAPAPAVSPPTIAERADVAALVERIVIAMRVGTAGRDHRASLVLGGRALENVRVELAVLDGRVRGSLRAPSQRADSARRVAESACEALRARGIDVEELVVEIT